MKKRVLAVLLAVSMVAALAVGCGSQKTEETAESTVGESTAEETTEEKTELTKISVVEPVRGILWAPVYVAQALGYFEEEGLDVEITTVQSDMPTAPVLADEAQFGLYGPEMISKFVAEGQDTQLVFTCTDTYPYSFITRQDIDDMTQLKGKAVAAADSGSGPRSFVRSIVNNAGLDPDNDVTYINMKNSAIPAALDSGEIVGTYASPELRGKLLDAGFKLAVDIYDKEVHKEVIGSDTYPMYIVFAKKSYIENNPEIAQAFVNACYKGAQYLDSHSAEEIVEAIKEMFPELEDIDAIVKEAKDGSIWSADGSFSEDSVKAVNNMAKSAGLITSDVAMEDLVNSELVENAKQNIK